MRVLISGGSGYFGSILIPALVRDGHTCINVDLREPAVSVPGLTTLRMDLSDSAIVPKVAKEGPFDAIFHLAAQIDFAVSNQQSLYENNVGSAETIAGIAAKTGCNKVIFTSSNSVYLGNAKSINITENDTPIPTDSYGRSKVDSELLFSSDKRFDTVTLRCPNIIDAGRVGMLSMLFDFVREGRRCWVIGNPGVRHQCLFAPDLVAALNQALVYEGSITLNIGSDNVPTMSQMFQQVIEHANTNATVVHVPKYVALPMLRAAHALNVSPLGPYQFRMLSRDFVFDTTRIRESFSWMPTYSNGEMLIKAYDYYVAHLDAILNDASASANRKAVRMGLLDLLRRIS